MGRGAGRSKGRLCVRRGSCLFDFVTLERSSVLEFCVDEHPLGNVTPNLHRIPYTILLLIFHATGTQGPDASASADVAGARHLRRPTRTRRQGEALRGVAFAVCVVVWLECDVCVCVFSLCFHVAFRRRKVPPPCSCLLRAKARA